jgi:serine/threonine protein kinase
MASDLVLPFPEAKVFVEILTSGQAAVFRCDWGAPATPVALKIYHPGSVLERNIREVAALRLMTCPQVCRLVDAGERPIRGISCQFMAMGYVDGHSLQQAMRQGTGFSEAEVLELLAACAKGIATIWAQRMVHRDIKPGNVMLSSSGPVIVDLGFARHLDLPALTSAGKTCGTYGYMSPEQWQGVRKLTSKSDIFSLAVTACEMLTGTHPTAGDQNRLASTSGFPVPKMTPPLSSLIKAMLSPWPHLRPGPKEVLKQLEAIK